MKNFRYLEGVTTLKYDTNKCIACGMCYLVCPHRVFEIKNNKAFVKDLDGCMECGACAHNCPVKAIELTPGVGCASYIIKTWIKGKDAHIECC